MPEVLALEADVLAPLIQKWHKLHQQSLLSDADLVGAFILAYAAIRRPKSWAAGLRVPVYDSSYPFVSYSLENIRDLIFLLDKNYLMRKLHASSLAGVTIATIFDSLNLYGVKKNIDNYINISMIEWYQNKRPYKLLFYIPFPIEVLKLQVQGQRVITMLICHEELSGRHEDKLAYMDGEHHHQKDCFEFLLHDMKHMENFCCADTMDEQVGFFTCMLQLDEVHPRRFFKRLGLDKQLWLHLEYLVADMNCYSTHLLRYLLAKLIFAVKRMDGYAVVVAVEGDRREQLVLNADGREYLSVVWRQILEQFGMAQPACEDAFVAAWELLAASLGECEGLNSSQWECIRDFFRLRRTATSITPSPSPLSLFDEEISALP